VFAALGGGYATAFSGSGTLQKGSRFLTGTLTDVRTLTGTGSIKANCASGSPAIRFDNTSGKPMNLKGTSTDGELTSEGIASGSSFQFDGDVTGLSTYNLHLSPADGSKAPQLDVQVTAKDTNNCATSYVTVLALNTQQ
jgi:hypothetical protein